MSVALHFFVANLSGVVLKNQNWLTNHGAIFLAYDCYNELVAYIMQSQLKSDNNNVQKNRIWGVHITLYWNLN